MKYSDLKAKGYKPVKNYKGLYINQIGEVYNRKTGKCHKLTARNYVIIDKRPLNVPKLVLQAFKGQKVRSGHIVYIDGNKRNLSPKNLKYAQIYTEADSVKIDYPKLLAAIRCYIEVKKSFTAKCKIITPFYLSIITDKRGTFLGKLTFEKEIFQTYVNGLLTNYTQTAKKHGLTFRDVSIILNSEINALSNEVLSDKKAGKLTTLPYFHKPTKKQKMDLLKQYCNERGIKIPPSPPPRKSLTSYFTK